MKAVKKLNITVVHQIWEAGGISVRKVVTSPCVSPAQWQDKFTAVLRKGQAKNPNAFKMIKSFKPDQIW